MPIWPTQECNNQVSKQDLTERLLDLDKPSIATWIWIHVIDYPFRQRMSEDRLRPEAGPQVYATFREFCPLVEHLAPNHLCDINARGSNHEGETALITMLAPTLKI